jgi:hypothetical protein
MLMILFTADVGTKQCDEITCSPLTILPGLQVLTISYAKLNYVFRILDLTHSLLHYMR